MDILYRLLMAFEALVCFLLIGIVLIQRSKGQGTGLSFGGGAEAVFGAQMGNVLTRATVVLAVLFLGNTTLLTVLRPSASSRSLADRLAREPAPATPAATLPAPADADPELARQAAAVLDTMNTAAGPAAADAAAVPAPTAATAPLAETAPATDAAPAVPPTPPAPDTPAPMP